MQAKVYNLAGDEVEQIELDDAIFGITPNMTVIHQAVLRQQANARQGTHETKTRAFVSGGGRKPWRQKGTGRARQGSTRSPQWRHGGVVFGPHPRSYEQDMPRKMRRLAIRGVLSSKVAEGRLVLVDSFDDLEPRTKAVLELMGNLNIGDDTALIMTSDGAENLVKAASNAPKITTMSAHLLSVVDMLKHNYIVMPRASLELVTNILSNTGGRNKQPLPGASAETASAPTKAEVVVEKPKAAPKPAAKAAPKAPRKPKAEAATQEETPEAKATLVPESTVAAEPAPAEKPKSASKKAAAPAAETAPVEDTHTSVSIAFGPVKISDVHYSGEEYVEITNNNDAPVDLGGWVLRDKNDQDQSFTFPEDTELAPGASLQVFTKPGHDYSFESKRPIWNDKGDELELVDASGKVADSYAYGSYAEEESEG